jgi:hypothetical protein
MRQALLPWLSGHSRWRRNLPRHAGWCRMSAAPLAVVPQPWSAGMQRLSAPKRRDEPGLPRHCWWGRTPNKCTQAKIHSYWQTHKLK